MSTETKVEVLARLRRRYATAGLDHKSKLLYQAVELLDYHRKAAIRALGHAAAPLRAPARVLATAEVTKAQKVQLRAEPERLV